MRNCSTLCRRLNHLHVAQELAVERTVLKLLWGRLPFAFGAVIAVPRMASSRYLPLRLMKAMVSPTRFFIETESAEGLPEKIVAKFAKDRKLPLSVFITRELSEQSYFRRAIEKHKISIDARSLIRTVPVITKLDPYILKHVEWIFFLQQKRG